MTISDWLLDHDWEANRRLFRPRRSPDLKTRRLPGEMVGLTDPRHGTNNGYSNLGCRCGRCKAANTRAHADYMRRNPYQRVRATIRQRKAWRAANGVSGTGMHLAKRLSNPLYRTPWRSAFRAGGAWRLFYAVLSSRDAA